MENRRVWRVAERVVNLIVSLLDSHSNNRAAFYSEACAVLTAVRERLERERKRELE